jgi:competence protein ComEC
MLQNDTVKQIARYTAIMRFFPINLPLYILVVLFVVNIFIYSLIFDQGREKLLTVAFLDVGQGDSIFIEAPNGNQMLIDGGANAQVLRELRKVMPFYDRSIDIVIATHPDQDHIGGLVEVVGRYDVKYFLDPGVESETAVYAGLMDNIEENQIERIIARRDTIIDLGDGVTLKVLFPDRDVSGVETNDASIITRLVYGESEVMMTGDAPKKIEEYVVSLDGEDLESDVLKVGHHGSKTSTSELFLGFVDPQYAIISAGENNRYGHPHQEVLDILETFDVPILNTSGGTIVFQSDGTDIWRD